MCFVLDLSTLGSLQIIMKNNDVLRRVRYIFDFSDSKMISLFELGGIEVTRAEISDWLKRDDNPDFKELPDTLLARFLNGLIVDKRGKKDGPEAEPEQKITNNITFRKLKIALNLQANDIIDIFNLTDFQMKKSELSSFFRKPGHRNYTQCKPQVLRSFLKGLQIKNQKTNEDDVPSSPE